MIAQKGDPLIDILPGDPQYTTISQLLWDLCGLEPLLPLVSLLSDTKQVLKLAALLQVFYWGSSK